MAKVNGQRLRELRFSKSITAADLAKTVGIPRRTLREIEEGKRQSPRDETIFAICKALGADPSEVLASDDAAASPEPAPARGDDAGAEEKTA